MTVTRAQFDYDTMYPAGEYRLFAQISNAHQVISFARRCLMKASSTFSHSSSSVVYFISSILLVSVTALLFLFLFFF